MKKIFFLLFLTPLFLNSKEERKRMLQIYKIETKVDEKLNSNESIYTFEFDNTNDLDKPLAVQFSIDGKNGEQLLEKESITIKTTPGKHVFQFFYSQNYYEIYSDSLEIKPKNHDTYRVRLRQSMQIEMSEKPVIYLYPETSTEVSVKIDIRGEKPFYYPAYNDAWKFTADPNGDLHFGEETYNYLFWEATTRSVLSPKQTATGFFVKGDQAVDFLEEKLNKAGLNSKEKADFITYWGPRLAQNKLNFVHFDFNQTCNQYADLTITPQPESVYRIYMIWAAVSKEFETEEQTIEVIDRTGFSVLEWGGQESHIRPSTIVK